MSEESSHEEILSDQSTEGDIITSVDSTNTDGNSSEEDDGEVEIPQNRSVYNRAAILQKYEDIKHDSTLPWSHYQIVNSGFTHDGVSAEDDFNREVSFYKQAVAGCIEAQVRMKSLGIKFKRPDDYFAEMVKSDSHMAKVRQNLLDQQKRIEAVEERRRQREMKKFGKKVQVEREQAKAQQKNQQIEAIKKWRKDQKNKSSDAKEDVSVLLDAEAKEKREAQGANQPKKQKNRKRQRKDEKYGFGGKRAKRNTADSSSDMSTFSVAKNKKINKEFMPLVNQDRKKKFPKNRGPSHVKRVSKR